MSLPHDICQRPIVAMSESTSTRTSKVIGTFRPCCDGYEPCTLKDSLSAYEKRPGEYEIYPPL